MNLVLIIYLSKSLLFLIIYIIYYKKIINY